MYPDKPSHQYVCAPRFTLFGLCAPTAQIREDVRFTLVEPIFTSAGVSAGIDLALRIVNHFFGIEIAQATARQMEYPYPERDFRTP